MNAEFINTKAEQLYGDRYFKEYIANYVGFDWRSHKKELSPYFVEQGFRVSMMNAYYYSSKNDIYSDRYLSPDIYFMYIVPALNRMEFKKAYADKSFYPILFRDCRQLEILASCASGRFYNSSRAMITLEEVVSLCLQSSGPLIMKPSIETGEGRGVALVSNSSKEEILQALDQYRKEPGFVVQKFLKQNVTMAKLNPSSLNTMRLYTYRRPDGRIVSLDQQHYVRFGSSGAWRDNIARGGGFCHIESDGRLASRVFTKEMLKPVSFTERFGYSPYFVPSFGNAIEFVKTLHSHLQYFDSVGWDIAIAEDGEPCLVEFNVDANLHGAQVIGGPMFGEYIDEVMERVKKVRKIRVGCEVNVFDYGYDRFTQIAGEEYDVL